MLYMFFFLIILRPPRSTRTDTLFPYTTLFRSGGGIHRDQAEADVEARLLPEKIEPGCEAARLQIDDRVADNDEGDGRERAQQDQLLEERSEEHTSELQSLMRISYGGFCLTKKNKERTHTKPTSINSGLKT